MKKPAGLSAVEEPLSRQCAALLGALCRHGDGGGGDLHAAHTDEREEAHDWLRRSVAGVQK